MTKFNTSLHANPFVILGITTRDDRRKIVAMAEERALHLDHDTCQKARADLTNPRTRLSAEMAWMPGVAPRVAEKLTKTLSDDPLSVRSEDGLPELARANLMAAAFELVGENEPAESIAEFIRDFAWVVEAIDADEVLRDVNEDRAISDFPKAKGVEAIEDELAERRKAYRSALKNMLDSMDPDKLVETMTVAVCMVTDNGESHGPTLIHEVVDAYEVETQGFLQKEAENIAKLVESIRLTAPQGERSVAPLIDQLERVARNWDRVAKPIQLSAKSRGTQHRPSREIAYDLRSLGIELNNEHDMLNQTHRMTELLRELFAELPEVAERLGEDAEAIEDLARKKQYSEVITPLRTLCREAADAAESNPSQADKQCQKIISRAPELLTIVERSGAPVSLITQAKDEVAYAITACAIEFGNKTSKWPPCLTMLEAANIFAVSDEAKARVTKNLDVVSRNVRIYGGLEQIDSAPSLYTINGCGVTLYGNTDPDKESGSYMATYYFVLIAIPIFPICRYRVINSGGNSYRFLGKGPLRTLDKWHIAITALIILFMFFGK